MNETPQIPEHIYQSYFARFTKYFHKKVGDAALAEDLAAATLNNAALNWSSLQTPDQPGPWLWTIAKNVWRTHVRDQTRKKRKGNVVPIDALENSATLVMGPDLERTVISRQRLRHIVDNYLAKLPKSLRITVEMYLIRDHDLAEVARLMKVPVGTVKSRINKFRNGLRAWEQTRRDDEDNDQSSSSRSST